MRKELSQILFKMNVDKWERFTPPLYKRPKMGLSDAQLNDVHFRLHNHVIMMGTQNFHMFWQWLQ